MTHTNLLEIATILAIFIESSDPFATVMSLTALLPKPKFVNETIHLVEVKNREAIPIPAGL